MTLKVVTFGDWRKAAAVLATYPDYIKRAVPKAIRLEAEFMVGEIKRNIQAGPPPPLAALTAKRRKGGKGGSKPLNASGDLLGAVTVVQRSQAYTAFVGVPRASGKYNIAVTHEQGRTIVLNMTEKMRRFLFGVLFKGEPAKPGSGTGIITIRIPARPFVRPAFEANAAGAAARFEANLAALLGGAAKR